MNISAEAIPLFKKVWSGYPESATFAYYLEYITFHLPPERLIPALQILIKNKLVGPRFLDFVQDDCNRSGLELVRQLTMRLEHEKKLRPIYRKDLQ